MTWQARMSSSSAKISNVAERSRFAAHPTLVYSIPQDQLSRGVVSYSSGNHAQAWVAIAAASVRDPANHSHAGRRAQIETRGHTWLWRKSRHLRSYVGQSRIVSARKSRKETGATLVPPYDHPWIIAGQRHRGAGLLEEVPDLDSLVVCIGGGG